MQPCTTTAELLGSTITVTNPEQLVVSRLVTLSKYQGHHDGEQIRQPDLLMGSGDIAAMVRIAHGVRMGMTVTDEKEA